MVRRYRLICKCCLTSCIGLLTAAMAVCLPFELTAAEDTQQLRLESLLEAGEFGPALELALKAPDSQLRDDWLSKVALAQASDGARAASLTTASKIANDASRSSVYASLRKQSLGARGGAAMADFDTLIELITSTVSPDSWDAVGGPGAIEPFPTGVLVESSGLMRRLEVESSSGLSDVRKAALRIGENTEARKASALRKVSLTRLEREAERLWADGKQPDPTMCALAGLRRVQFLLLFPETRDIVLAGPAGDWTTNAEGRLVSAADGTPVLQMDDLVVLLRNAMSEYEGRFDCAIVPREANLSDVQEFLRGSANRSLKPGERDAWIAELRRRLGRQDIRFNGIDPRSRVARVLVEADYHMKLIGMGLKEGTLGVSSYLDSVEPGRDGSVPAMDVLRWWFTLNYDSIKATGDRDVFELRGPGVKVQSENELLAERGRRVHTGVSDEKNQKFAHDFTRHFQDLAVKYPVYAELRNVFDLAVAASLIRSQKLAERIDWKMPFFGRDGSYATHQEIAPLEVESIVNHRFLDGRRFIVGVSGGVVFDARSRVSPQAIETADHGQLEYERDYSRPRQESRGRWWWD